MDSASNLKHPASLECLDVKSKGNSRPKTLITGSRRVVLVAVMSATISAGKLALAFLPNIEIVTLLCALYGIVFGALGVAAAVIFVLCETLIWGTGTWALAYIIYWPLVALCFWLLGAMKVSNRLILTLVATILTIIFGFLTALIDIGLLAGAYDRFWQRFIIYYSRGLVFYIVHVSCNIACFSCAFRPLSDQLIKCKNRRILKNSQGRH